MAPHYLVLCLLELPSDSLGLCQAARFALPSFVQEPICQSSPVALFAFPARPTDLLVALSIALSIASWQWLRCRLPIGGVPCGSGAVLELLRSRLN